MAETEIAGALAHLPGGFDAVIEAMSRGIYDTIGWVQKVSLEQVIAARRGWHESPRAGSGHGAAFLRDARPARGHRHPNAHDLGRRSVQGRVPDKVAKLGEAGLTCAQIIGEPSEARAVALIDAVEGIVATGAEQALEQEELLFSGLVPLGPADAIDTRSAEHGTAVGQAWRDALGSTIENRDPDLGILTQLRSSDRPGYNLALANDVVVDWAAVARIESATPAE